MGRRAGSARAIGQAPPARRRPRPRGRVRAPAETLIVSSRGAQCANFVKRWQISEDVEFNYLPTISRVSTGAGRCVAPWRRAGSAAAQRRPDVAEAQGRRRRRPPGRSSPCRPPPAPPARRSAGSRWRAPAPSQRPAARSTPPMTRQASDDARQAAPQPRVGRGGVVHAAGAAPELDEHHPAGHRGAERRRGEADAAARGPSAIDGVDEHRVQRVAEGRAGVLAGVVDRRDHLLQHEGRQARRRRSPPRARWRRCRRRPKAPRWKSTDTIGPGISISATAAGRVSARVNSVARLIASRPPWASPAFSRRERSGRSTTPMAMPTTPSGSW